MPSFRSLQGALCGMLLWTPALCLLGQHQTPGSLVFQAETELERSQRVLITRAQIQNRGSDSVWLEIGGDCPIFLRVYQQSRRVGQPIWDGGRKMCFDISHQLILGPGELWSSPVLQDSLANVMRSDLPLATYYFTTVFGLRSGRLAIPSGSARLGHGGP
jgi:hypothetical protein